MTDLDKFSRSHELTNSLGWKGLLDKDKVRRLCERKLVRTDSERLSDRTVNTLCVCVWDESRFFITGLVWFLSLLFLNDDVDCSGSLIKFYT